MLIKNTGIWILLALLGVPAGALGQEEAGRIQTNRGWIGISLDYSTTLVGGREATVGLIVDVVRGSPAASAGIRVGDTLTHIDGQPISPRVLTSLSRSVEAGDLVRLTVLRRGQAREILVEAAPQRPERWVLERDAGQVVIRLDSMKGAILENLDSLRVSIAGLKVDSSGDVAIHLLKPRGEPAEIDEWLNLTYRIRGPGGDSLRFTTQEVLVFEPDLAVPFTAMVASAEETQELRDRLKRVRGELTEVRRQELARERELRASVQGPVEEVIRQDARIRELREREQQLIQEVNQLNAQLEAESQLVIRRHFAEVQSRQERAMAQAIRAQEETARRSETEREEILRARERALQQEYELRRPLQYIIAGQSFVAGAQLQSLNPDLAGYFQVDEGVLVTEVLEGTPASAAGLMAGDVIVGVGGEPVSSLDDLRFGVGYFERPIPLRVIRKGNPVEIVIR